MSRNRIAKRNIIDYIWKSAKLEVLGVTYPDTGAIFNGVRDPNVKVKEIVAVNNLKLAWQFLLDYLDVPSDYNYVCHQNKIVFGTERYVHRGRVQITADGNAHRLKTLRDVAEKDDCGLCHSMVAMEYLFATRDCDNID